MLSEKVRLLGKGMYTDIPDELTLKAIPTLAELDYVGSEDFDSNMLKNILPVAVEEKIDFGNLLEIDYQWVCRCLRMLNFGPYHTTNSIFCSDCNKTSYGDYQVDLRTIECKPLPDKFKNDIILPKNSLLDYEGDIKLRLPTIKQMLAAYKDKAFNTADGRTNRELARICYMIYEVGGETMPSPLDVKFKIEKELSAADYVMLKELVDEANNYGLRAGGRCICPKCGSTNAAYVALVDDRFFRCTVDNLRRWRDDKRAGNAEDVLGNKATAI